jgi:uncharacterized protein YciI
VVEKPRPGSGSGERLTVRVAYAAIRELHGVRTDVRDEVQLGDATVPDGVQWAHRDGEGRLLVATEDAASRSGRARRKARPCGRRTRARTSPTRVRLPPTHRAGDGHRKEEALKHVVIARDGTDDGAKARRAAVRPEHLRQITPRVERGEVLLGGAILDEADEMVGSVLVVEFETREELDAWLTTDPYVTGGVWQEIEVQPYRPAVGAWVRDA